LAGCAAANEANCEAGGGGGGGLTGVNSGMLKLL